MPSELFWVVDILSKHVIMAPTLAVTSKVRNDRIQTVSPGRHTIWAMGETL